MVLFRLPFQGRYTLLAVCDSRREPYLLNFFNELGANLQKDAISMLALLESCAQNGLPRNTEISHKLDGAIWEFIRGRLRVLWFTDEGRVIVCTHGFIKKSQRTPAREIRRAERMYQDYLAAKEVGELVVEEETDGSKNL
jgi:phage-related protein